MVKTKKEIIKSYYTGTMTDVDFQTYVSEYMTEEEKLIGKPYFLMTEEEQQTYDIMQFNNSVGELTGVDCPKCKNKGFIRYLNNEGYVMNRECSCMATRKTIKRMEESGLGNLLELYTFDKYKTDEDWQKNTLEKAKKFVDDKSIAFTILGASGTGKSMICTAIASELMKKGMSLKYMMWVEDVNFLKETDYIYRPVQEKILSDYEKETKTREKPKVIEFLKEKLYSMLERIENLI